MNPWLDFLFQISVGYSPNKRAEKKERKSNNNYPKSQFPVGAQSTSTPLTALHQAAISNHLEQIRVLLRLNHPIDPKDHLGKTPLMYAIEKKNLFVVRALLSSGASCTIKNKKEENACDLAQKSNHSQIIKAIDEHLKSKNKFEQ